MIRPNLFLALLSFILVRFQYKAKIMPNILKFMTFVKAQLCQLLRSCINICLHLQAVHLKSLSFYVVQYWLIILELRLSNIRNISYIKARSKQCKTGQNHRKKKKIIIIVASLCAYCQPVGGDSSTCALAGITMWENSCLLQDSLNCLIKKFAWIQLG